MQNNPKFWQNEQKVPRPITKSITHVQCCTTDELCYLLACNLYQNKEEGKAIHFFAEISEGKKSHFFTINNLKSTKRSLFDVPENTGHSFFEDPECSRHSFLNAQSTQGTQIKLYEFLEHSGTQIKSNRSAPSPLTKSTWCAPGHQIACFLLIFNCQL